MTYAELAELVNRTGHVLRDLGVRQEQRVLLALGDGVEFVATWYAAQKIGAVTAEVYTFLPAKDLPYYLQYTRAGVVVADVTTLERVREARGASPWLRTVLAVGVPDERLRDGEASFDALVAAAPAELDPAPTTPDDVAIWKFTTGSTGTPKACVHRMETPLRSFEHYAQGVLGIHADDVVLPVPKLFFGYARDLAALYPFGVGAAGVVFAERTTAERMFELIAAHRPTILVNVPTMMRAMVEHAEQDLSCLRLCTSAGEALPEELTGAGLDTFGVEVLDGIGSSEAYHIYISNRPGAAPGRHARPGRARLRGARSSTTAAASWPTARPGACGSRATSTALMYWQRPRQVAGDLRRRRGHERRPVHPRHGRLFPLPRPRRRHAQGRRHLGRAAGDRALPGRASRRGRVCGGRLRGRTASRSRARSSSCARAAAVDAAALQAYVKASLAPHKSPRDVRFVDALPRTGSGKVDRRALQEVSV